MKITQASRTYFATDDKLNKYQVVAFNEDEAIDYIEDYLLAKDCFITEITTKE